MSTPLKPGETIPILTEEGKDTGYDLVWKPKDARTKRVPAPYYLKLVPDLAETEDK